MVRLSLNCRSSEIIAPSDSFSLPPFLIVSIFLMRSLMRGSRVLLSKNFESYWVLFPEIIVIDS